MLFKRTHQFNDDFDNLEKKNQKSIIEAFPNVKKALEGDAELFSYFRIKQMHGHKSIWEGHVKDNLCFTFHYEIVQNNQKACLFRRVGTHDIYRSP